MRIKIIYFNRPKGHNRNNNERVLQKSNDPGETDPLIRRTIVFGSMRYGGIEPYRYRRYRIKFR